MIAVVMAGGKSSRFLLTAGGDPSCNLQRGVLGWASAPPTDKYEKPLAELNGVKLITRVIDAVRASNAVACYVAVSRHTPQTKIYCEERGLNLIETEGSGYHEDINVLLERHPAFLSIVVDNPFVTGEVVNAVLDAYEGTSVTGCVPLSVVPRSIEPEYTFEFEGGQLVPVGVNIVTRAESSIPLELNEPLLALNVNTIEDLALASTLMMRRCRV